MGFILGDLGKQHGEFLVGKIESSRITAIDADQPFILAVGVKLLECRSGRRTSTMTTVLKNDDVVLAGATQVVAKLINDVLASRIGVPERFDAKSTTIEGGC